MNYGLIYTVPFAAIDNTPCVVEIEKKDYSGDVTELVGGASPFVVQLDDESYMYTPMRLSTATLRLVGGDSLQSLFATGYQEYRVTLFCDGTAKWCGYIKPEIYTQDYSRELFELEIECSSSLSTLEYIDYKTMVEGSKGFVYLWDLLKKCISLSGGRYNNIYLPETYTFDPSMTIGANVFAELSVSEQNFFDEDGKAMPLKDVLSEICKLFAFTCVDYNGDVYFIDVDHTGKYQKYSTDMTLIGLVDQSTVSVQTVGFAGSGHTLDALPGYNKVTIKCSNYPVGDVIPPEKYNVVAKSDGVHIFPEPQPVTPGIRDEMFLTVRQEPTTYKLFDGNLLNAIMLCRTCIYKLERQSDGTYKPTISEFSYDDCIRIITKRIVYDSRTSYHIETLKNGTILLTFAKELPCAVYSGGAFCISGSVAQSNNVFNHLFSQTRGSTKPVELVCELGVGDMFWSGTEWTSTQQSFNIKVTPKGYGFSQIDSTRKLGMPYSEDGLLIELPETPLRGSVSFRMRTPVFDDEVTAVYIKDFKIKFLKKLGSEDDSDSDRLYENVINSEYINELDEIELKISTYNNDGACYSKLLHGDEYLTDKMYSRVEGAYVRLEEALIRRIINRYKSTKIKLTQVLRNDAELSPFVVLSDKFMVNKKFAITGGEIDYKYNNFSCVMTEL